MCSSDLDASGAAETSAIGVRAEFRWAFLVAVGVVVLNFDLTPISLSLAAVSKLANEVLPTYEPDDGLLTDKEMAAIRKAAGPVGTGKVLSSLF